MTAISSLVAPKPIRDYQQPPGGRAMQPRNAIPGGTGAATSYFAGGLVCHRAGSDICEHPDPLNPRSDFFVAGAVRANAAYTTGTATDANGGALLANGQPDSLMVDAGYVGWFDTLTGAQKITNANVDQVCYLVDNNTLSATNPGGLYSVAGYVAQVRALDGRVKLRIDPNAFFDYLSASGISITQDDTVRAVATSLPAGTFAANAAGNFILTLTATGAFATAQDGVTLAVGDKFIIPAGTITTLVVTAAQSGVYEVVGLGATGVSATFVRSQKWAQSAIITPGTKIRVGAEGTLFSNTMWTAGPATATKVVGTDDPALYPDKVMFSQALAAGTFTTASVPIRSATKSQVLYTRTTANTTASTIDYASTTFTPGAIGTASIVTIAAVAAGTINVADLSTLSVTVLN